MNTTTSITAATRTVLVVALCGYAVYATAQEQKTRADVGAELDAARAIGELHAFTGEDSGSFWLAQQPQLSTLARHAVRAEVLAARALGQLHMVAGEASGEMYVATNAPQPGLVYAGPNVGEKRPAVEQLYAVQAKLWT